VPDAEHPQADPSTPRSPIAQARKWGPMYAFLVGWIVSLVTITKGLKHVNIVLERASRARSCRSSIGVGPGDPWRKADDEPHPDRRASDDRDFHYASVEKTVHPADGVYRRGDGLCPRFERCRQRHWSDGRAVVQIIETQVGVVEVGGDSVHALHRRHRHRRRSGDLWLQGDGDDRSQDHRADADARLLGDRSPRRS
jgi:hypothetical protein